MHIWGDKKHLLYFVVVRLGFYSSEYFLKISVLLNVSNPLLLARKKHFSCFLLISLKHDCCISYRLIFGTLYPAYSSYKAVKSKDVREYVSTALLHFHQLSSTLLFISLLIL